MDPCVAGQETQIFLVVSLYDCMYRSNTCSTLPETCCKYCFCFVFVIFSILKIMRVLIVHPGFFGGMPFFRPPMHSGFLGGGYYNRPFYGGYSRPYYPTTTYAYNRPYYGAGYGNYYNGYYNDYYNDYYDAALDWQDRFYDRPYFQKSLTMLGF